MNNLVFNISLIFGISLIVSIMLYIIGLVVSPKGKDTIDKLVPYACGEDFPARKFQVNVRNFFLYVTFFMIFDISAFILALSFGNQGFYPLLFSAMILFTLFLLFPVWRRNE